MRVAVLSTSFPLTPDSCSGIFVAHLLDSLPSGIEVTVITPASQQVASPLRRGALHVLPVRYAPAGWQRLAHAPGGLPVALSREPWLYAIVPILLVALAFRLHRVARRCHVIHANWAIGGLLGALVCRFIKRPLITTLRGEDITRAKRGGLSRTLLAQVLRSSMAVTVVSTDMAAWIRKEFPEFAGRIVVVENGVDPAFLSISRVQSASGHPPTLVTVGSLIPRKGIDTLIRGLAHSRGKEWRFRIIGAGDEQSALQRLADELGVAGNVDFVGALPPRDIPAMLADADIFLLGSHSEGRPNALIEAMAAALPAIASQIDGITELIEDEVNGLLVPPGDDAAWGRTIARLLGDPQLRQRLGVSARASIVGRGLTWQAGAERYAAIYRELAGR